jgi:hypothetical protein
MYKRMPNYMVMKHVLGKRKNFRLNLETSYAVIKYNLHIQAFETSSLIL